MINWQDRLAIVSDEASKSFADAVEICLPLGIRAYELRHLGETRFPHVPDATVDAVLALVKAHDLKLVGVSPGFFKQSVDHPSTELAFTEGFPRAFRLMERLGVQRLAVFSFARGNPVTDMNATGTERPISPKALEQLQRAKDLCQREGIELAIENSAGCWADSGENLACIAQAIQVNVTWDPANAAASGERAFPDGYAHVRDLVDYVHCKNWGVDGGNVAINDGAVDWAGQIAALKADSYTGYFCIEPHQWHDRANATRLNTAQLLALLETH